jgi:hypothetical protein
MAVATFQTLHERPEVTGWRSRRKLFHNSLFFILQARRNITLCSPGLLLAVLLYTLPDSQNSIWLDEEPSLLGKTGVQAETLSQTLARGTDNYSLLEPASTNRPTSLENTHNYSLYL